MMKQILSLVVLIVLAALLPAAAAADTETGGASPDSLEIDDGANNRLLSLGFIPNVGQYDPVVDYVLHYQDTTVFFMRDGLVLAHTAGSAENVSRDVIRQSFAGASPETHLAARDQRAGVVNYYVGNDSSKWLSGIPVYSEVVYEDLYPGIDLVYAEKNGRLKREFRISPGADPSRIKLIYGGERAPRVDADGVLRFASPAGEMLESPLVCWQVIGGEKVDRVAEYVVDDGSVRIAVAEYDAGHELIVDPELVYSSYLGGGEGDYGYALAGDGDGGVWVTGYTASPDFPVLDDSDGKSGHIAFVSHFASNGTLLSSTCLGGARSLGGTRSDYGHVLAGDDEGGVWVIGTTGSDFPVLNASQSAYGGDGDVFVSHFSSSGTLLSSTYLGGGGIELDNALVGDGDGGVWVAGLTTSTDLPVTEDAYQSTYGGGSGDAFVSHFSSTGALLSSTYLGGENYDYGSALAGDGAGGVWVMGGNQYGGFPVLNEYQRTNSGGWDVFVSHFSSSGTLLSSTYLGGSDHDDGSALVGDGDGGVWVTGETLSLYVPDSSKGFPVRNASQRTNGGGYFDAFVSHLSSEGALLSSTYLGGDEHDSGYALAGDGDGGVWVTGRTRSADFPVRNAHQSAYGGGFSYGDRFVSHFSSEGALLSSTYLGGEADDCDGDKGREDDHRYTLVGDDAGGAWVTGSTASTAFPVLDEYQSTNGGGWDAFVSHFASDGALLLSTSLGGDGDDHGRALAGDGHGGVWVTGYTGSPSFPVLNAYQSSYGGSSDVFVARFGIDDPVPVHPPTADFTANVTSGTAPLAVRFTDTSTGEITAWSWDFGDGNTSSERDPVHTYTTPGTYTVALTVSNSHAEDTMRMEHYIQVQKPLPSAELIFNVNYNRGTSNDSIASGTSPCSLAYYTSVHNPQENQESILGDLVFVLDAQEIVSVSSGTCAEINGTQVTWTIPSPAAISPGTGSSTSAATSATADQNSGVTLERSCNRTVFTEAGVQQVTLNITFDTIDLDDLWGRIMCTNTTDVGSAFVPGTISTDLPLRGLSEGRAGVHFMVDRSRVETGRQYTLSCAVEVNPLRPVAYAPACAVWEVRNLTSAVAPAGTAVTIPAEFLPGNVSSVAFSSATPCEWTCIQNEHIITSLYQRAVPAPAANFTADVTSGTAPLTVRFTDTSTGEITVWSWSFGDGNTSTEQNPVHTYGAPGNYTVNLTVSTGTGSDTFSRPGYITVTVKGDFNGDGEVDIGDVSRVAHMVVGKTAIDLAADFNGNGAVDIGDAAKIAYYFVGKIEAL